MPVSSFFNPLEFAQGFARKISQGYGATDKALGGLLPGGGTISPVTKAVQAAQPAAQRFAGSIRDQAVIPIIDEGIRTGLLPTKQTMFARYLTGTSKPLTVYPAPLLQDIKNTYNKIAIEDTRKQVDEIYKKENPQYRQYELAQTAYNTLANQFRNRAEISGVSLSPQEEQNIRQLEDKRNALRQSLGINEYTNELPKTFTDQERLAIIRQRKLASPENVTINYQAAYRAGLPQDVQLSLGRFNIKDNTIADRYKFDYLETGREKVPEWKQPVYPDARGGGPMASNLIELGLKTGIINPKSGYDVRIPLNQ